MNPFEKNDFYITDFIEALKIVKSPLNTLVTNKNRKHWALALKKNGTTVYHFNNSDYIADKFHPILLPKHGCYTWMCTSPGECLMFEFECNISSEKPISFFVKDTTFIETAFSKIIQRSMQNSVSARMKNISDLYSVLSVLFDTERFAAKSRYDIILPAVKLMNEFYYLPDITNKKLAEQCKISTVYFRQLFKKCYGISPIAYLNNLRIKKAQELLISDNVSIEQVAVNVGYNSIYHFSKMFKLKTGISPRKYAGNME